ncbi:MAG: hypothetical protein GC180_03800 [Bacteroidetes bacterium]|nr:hypothetical protein [Bacteroidota bacterium]
MALKFTLFGNTNVGSVRDHNEDNFTVCSDLSENIWSFSKDEPRSLSKKGALLVVADGMGGTNAGEVASDIAQQSVRESFVSLKDIPQSQKERENFLKKCILDAHQKIVKHQEENLETAGMGTTLVISWIIDDMLHTAWSGDSRCYLFDPGQELEPFSEDHSLVWDLVKKGDMTPEEARTHPNSNIINQSLGDPKSTPHPDVKSRKLYQDSRVLVCSDGLNGMLSDAEIQSYLENSEDVEQACRKLVDAANEAGGHDNITCLLMEVKEGEKAPVGGIPTSRSTPTPTGKLRKKVKTNYAIIGVLLVIVAVLLYYLAGPKSDSPKPLSAPGAQQLEIFPSKDFNLEMNHWSHSITDISGIRWKNGNYEIEGTTVVLKSPIHLEDTLFVLFHTNDEKGSDERAFIFTAIEGSDLNSDRSSGSDIESQSDAPARNNGSETTRPEAPVSTTPVQNTERNPVNPVVKPDTSTSSPVTPPITKPDTTKTGPSRPILNPINHIDTSK